MIMFKRIRKKGEGGKRRADRTEGIPTTRREEGREDGKRSQKTTKEKRQKEAYLGQRSPLRPEKPT